MLLKELYVKRSISKITMFSCKFSFKKVVLDSNCVYISLFNLLEQIYLKSQYFNFNKHLLTLF